MIKNLASASHLRVAGLAAGIVAIAAGAVWVTASAAGYNVNLGGSTAPRAQAGAAGLDVETTRAAVCSKFVSHLAADLNTSESNLTAAFQKALGQTLDDEVKNGDITQAQADAIKAKLAGKAPCSLIAAGGFRKAPGADLGAYKAALLDAAASALGITTDALKADLAKGMSLSQIAAAQHPAVTEAQFRTRLIQKLTPVLDKAVADKKITKAQEQAILQRLQTGPIPFWNAPIKKRTTAPTAAGA